VQPGCLPCTEFATGVRMSSHAAVGSMEVKRTVAASAGF
jgi:hypothetical protein